MVLVHLIWLLNRSFDLSFSSPVFFGLLLLFLVIGLLLPLIRFVFLRTFVVFIFVMMFCLEQGVSVAAVKNKEIKKDSSSLSRA